ncbi:MAG: hypothetical protein LBL94_11860, partial [Prevotellaceae bacterium]|nr:hypothetical protein [Prevotellaceae bacterium]
MKAIKYIFTTVILCLSCSYIHAEVIPSIEFDALRTLYSSFTNPDKATLLTGWDVNRIDSNVTSWRGITVENGHIAAIDLSNIGLEGNLSTLSFVYLQKLKRLNLSNNKFQGNFPAFTVGKAYPPSSMFDLEELIIDNNEFLQSALDIPEQCAKLKIVSAENNRLQGFYIDNNDFIKEINLKNNNLYHQHFRPVHYYKSDNVDIQVEKIDVRDNRLNFGSLWKFANPQQVFDFVDVQDPITHYWHIDTLWNCDEDIYRNPQVDILLSPQATIFMGNTVSHGKVRSRPGRSVFVQLPDVGHRNDGLWSDYPEIRDSLSFQWYRNGVALAKDTFPDFTRASVTDEDFGKYHCEVTGKTVLKELTMQTQTFEIADEENMPPVLAVPNGIEQPQRIKKGQTPKDFMLKITDDWLAPPSASVPPVISHPLSHLEFVGDLRYSYIQVRDTSAAWLGKDSMQITYCDYEGACGSVWLYFVVYEDLLPPPIATVQATADQKIALELDLGFYDTQSEKPDSFHAFLEVMPGVYSGIGNYIQVASVTIPSSENRIVMNIPENTQEYTFQLKIRAQNSSGLSLLSYFAAIMPVKADEDLTASGDATGVTLTWTLTSSAIADNWTDDNAIYRSVDGGDFTLIGWTDDYQVSYVDNDVEAEHIYRYKLIKSPTAYISGKETQIELPSFASNIAKISTKSGGGEPEEEDLLPPPVATVAAGANATVALGFDVGFYGQQAAKPDALYAIVSTSPDVFATPARVDSVAAAGLESLVVSIPKKPQEYLLQLDVFAQNSHQRSVDFTRTTIPVSVQADENLTASGDSTGVSLSWTLASAASLGDYTYNAVYRSVDSGNYSRIVEFTDKNQASYVDYNVEARHTYRYKLVKKTYAYSGGIKIGFELPYLESNTAEISTTPEINEGGGDEDESSGSGDGDEGSGNGDEGSGNGDEGSGNGDEGSGNGDEGSGNGDEGSGNGDEGD